MPHLIISTVALLSNLYKNAPLIVGDKDSDPDLMRFLGARITTNYPACGSPPMYVMHAPPRTVFDNLEKRGYCLMSAQTIQEHSVWILARPRVPDDDKVEIARGGPNDKSIQAFDEPNAASSSPGVSRSVSQSRSPNTVKFVFEVPGTSPRNCKVTPEANNQKLDSKVPSHSSSEVEKESVISKIEKKPCTQKSGSQAEVEPRKKCRFLEKTSVVTLEIPPAEGPIRSEVQKNVENVLDMSPEGETSISGMEMKVANEGNQEPNMKSSDVILSLQVPDRSSTLENDKPLYLSGAQTPRPISYLKDNPSYEIVDSMESPQVTSKGDAAAYKIGSEKVHMGIQALNSDLSLKKSSDVMSRVTFSAVKNSALLEDSDDSITNLSLNKTPQKKPLLKRNTSSNESQGHIDSNPNILNNNGRKCSVRFAFENGMEEFDDKTPMIPDSVFEYEDTDGECSETENSSPTVLSSEESVILKENSSTDDSLILKSLASRCSHIAIVDKDNPLFIDLTHPENMSCLTNESCCCEDN